MKKIVYIDMDGVLCNFQKGIESIPDDVVNSFDTVNDDGTIKHNPDNIPGIFLNLEPMPGAIDAVEKLMEVYDVYICTTSPWDNPTALNDKLTWIKNHFGNKLKKRVIMTHNKNLCHGDYIIDDNKRNGVDKFNGYHIWFGHEYKTWNDVLKFLLP